MKPRGRQIMAWLLTAAVTLSGNSFTVLADEMDVQVQQEASENEEEIFAAEETEPVQDEVVEAEEDAEISFAEETQDEIRIDDTEDQESDQEAEIQIEEAPDESENTVSEGFDDVSAFSSDEESVEEGVEYYLPEDDEILLDWTYNIQKQYDGWAVDEDDPDGIRFNVPITSITVDSVREENDSGEIDTSPVCWVQPYEWGWQLQAKRFGTAKVTLEYINYNGNTQEHTFYIHVNGDKYTLEVQLPLSDNNMLKNSEQEFPFRLRHQWKYDEDNDGDVYLDDWALNFAPNKDGWKYNTDILKDVLLNDNKVVVKSKDATGGTNILLKAVFNTENGPEEALYNLWVNVRSDYDILYPESLNIATGETLDLNDPDVGLRVENIKEDVDPSDRDDVTYDVEYDENQWKNIAEEGQRPVLRRITNDGTWLNIIARNEEGRELCRRNYQFEYEDYAIWFKDLREGDYSTYVYEDETETLKLNTDNLNETDATVSWEVGYRTEEVEDEGDSFEAVDTSQDWCFWTENSEDNQLSIDGKNLMAAYEWLWENIGEDYWFEARAHVMVNDVEVHLAQAGINIRECREEYELPTDEVILKDDNYFVNRGFGCRVENAEYPDGDWIPLEFSSLFIENEEGDDDEEPVCDIEHQDENGWNVIARRYGTAVLTLTYEDLSGNEQECSFKLYVNPDKYTLEPQWDEAEGRMLRNSEMTLGFVLRHEWKYDDEDRKEREVDDWELALAPDENGRSYDTNLLKNVEINNDEKKRVVESGDETGGTDILLKALIPSENGDKEVTSNQVYINVCDEYNVLYPTEFKNLSVGEILDPEKDLKVVRISDDGENDAEVDHYEVKYDPDQWDKEERENRLPFLIRKTADGCWLEIIAKDADGGEIQRRYYEFEWLDYSVWFENQRGEEENNINIFEDEQYELSLNTENLELRGVKDTAHIMWAPGYAYEAGADDVVSEREIPEEYVFWSENPKDNSKLTIDGRKLMEAYEWLHGEKGENSWFEVRASVEVEGEVVFEDAYIQLGEVWRNEEEYYIKFGVTLSLVPGDTIWFDDFLEGYIRDKDHADGEDIRAEITKVSVDDTTCCSIAYQGNGWCLKALKNGTTTLELVYTDYHGKQQKGEFILSVQDESYWMNYNLGRSEMLPGEEKEINISAYHATKDNLDGEEVDPAEYNATVEKWDQKDPIEVTADDKGTVTIKVADDAELDMSYGFNIRIESKEKDEEDKPIWAVDGEISVFVTEKYPDRIQLKENVILNPALGDIFDINAYEPALLRYDVETGEWNSQQIDNETFRFTMKWDDSVWTAQDDSSLPVLERTGVQRGAIWLFAQEYNSEENEWHTIAEDCYYVNTIFYKDGKCVHKWETVIDVKGNCGTTQKQHKLCTACQKTEPLPDIPATGKHTMSGWKVTKQATALAAGIKEQTCTECGLKKQETIAKLAATLTLNVPVNKTVPMKMKQTYQLKASGLAKGDKVVSWTSNNKKVVTVSGNGKLKALKKTGKAVITVKLASGKTAKFTVKVQKADVATTSLTVLNKATGKKIPKTVSLKAKKNLALAVTVAPVTSKQKVTYATSDKSIATINAKGVITAKKKGTVTITVKSGKKKVTFKVKVTK